MTKMIKLDTRNSLDVYLLLLFPSGSRKFPWLIWTEVERGLVVTLDVTISFLIR